MKTCAASSSQMLPVHALCLPGNISLIARHLVRTSRGVVRTSRGVVKNSPGLVKPTPGLVHAGLPGCAWEEVGCEGLAWECETLA